MRKKNAERAAWIRPFKSVPCADCGATFHPVSMDFDHRDPTTKIGDISTMLYSGKFEPEEIIAEIAKCDVICANCHRLRTFRILGAEW